MEDIKEAGAGGKEISGKKEHWVRAVETAGLQRSGLAVPGRPFRTLICIWFTFRLKERAELQS